MRTNVSVRSLVQVEKGSPVCRYVLLIRTGVAASEEDLTKLCMMHVDHVPISLT